MGKVLRKSQMFGGLSAQEYHSQVLARKCAACGKPALVVIRSFAPAAELRAEQMAALLHAYGGDMPFVDTPQGVYVRVGDIAVCPACECEAERAAAKHPSNWYVDIDRGPAPDRAVFRVEA